MAILKDLASFFSVVAVVLAAATLLDRGTSAPVGQDIVQLVSDAR